jgi:hypothetical protein
LFWNERQPTFLGHPTTFFLGCKISPKYEFLFGFVAIIKGFFYRIFFWKNSQKKKEAREILDWVC